MTPVARGFGAAAVVVSNQRRPPARLRRRYFESAARSSCAVARQIEVLMDGGVRRGGDIVKAVCMARVQYCADGPTPMVCLLPESGVARAD